MVVISLLAAALLAQQPPTPQPFPRPGGTSTARPLPPAGAPSEPAQGQKPATAPAPSTAPAPAPTRGDAAPSEATLGVTVYPGAQFIASYDAGRGQRYYLFGTISSFSALVSYYRTLLKQRGELIFEAPATHQFDTGRFREESMAFPPSVTIKDYQSEISQGYPNPKPGAEPARFPTIIQIVPAAETR
jgi:hypothetical protein